MTTAHVLVTDIREPHNPPFVSALDAIALAPASLGKQALRRMSATSKAALAETLEL